MPGWWDEAEAEDIDNHADRVVNNDGESEYTGAYATARRLKEAGRTLDEIRQAIVREPAEPNPNRDGLVPNIHRKHHAGQRRLAAIRSRAVEDLWRGTPPRYAQ
jgi:hypothetical protein